MMKRRIKTLIACITGFALSSCAQNNIRNVDASEFEQGIKNDSIQLLDVRTSDEFATSHINGAINIDVLKEGFKHIAKNKLDRKHEIWIYCRSGKRSLTAASILAKDGYKVVNLRGGIKEWEKKGKPVVR
ncbi:rhodanese-like domain-containing protein [Xylanibacter muris]